MNIPQELNWVDKRAACTAAEVFNLLCDGIEQDVLAFNSVKRVSENDEFRADVDPAGTKIVVGRETGDGRDV